MPKQKHMQDKSILTPARAPARKMLPSQTQDRKRVWLSWAVSYVLVLLIPVMISAAVYVEASRIVQREISQAHQVLLTQIRQSLDRQLADIERLSLQIAWNPRLKALFNNMSFSAYQRYNISLLVQDFRLYKVANAFVDDFFVYLNKSGTVISPMSFYDSRFLENNKENTDRITLTQWKSLQDRVPTREMILLDVKDTTGLFRKNVAFVHSLPWETPEQALATLAVIIDEKRFFETISGIPQDAQGNILVLDGEGRLVTAKEPISWDVGMLGAYAEKDGTHHLKIDGQTQVVSFTPSRTQSWTYVYVMPESLFLAKLSRLRLLMWMSLGLCLLVGGVAAWFFARKHYAPIQNLVELIASKAGIKLERQLNEFRFIEESLSETLSEQDRVRRLLQKQDHLLRNHQLMQLLNGKAPDQIRTAEVSSATGLSFASDVFAVSVLYLDDYQALFESEEEEDPWEQLELVQFILRNVLEEMLGRRHIALVGELDGSLCVCLVNADEPEVDLSTFGREIVEVLGEAKQFLLDKFHIGLTIGAGDAHRGSGSIVQSYREAMDALGYRLTLGAGSLVEYRDIGDPVPLYSYSLNQEQQLINRVKSGDYEGARQIVEEIYTANLEGRIVNVQMAKCLMSDLVSSILKTVTELGCGEEDDVLDALAPIDRVLQADTVMDMKARMLDVLRDICVRVDQRQTCLHAHLGPEVSAYVQAHHADPNLSIKMVGSAFHLTPAYLSRLFREQTGESLPDYINRYRLDKVKERLENSQDSINHIAELTGFTNSNSLIRTFKKYEGITPGQYKANLRI